MNQSELWKNFSLGQEVSVAGTFIYNGLRCFHEMRTLENADEIFEVLYNLSVGLERLLKVAVILLEHSDGVVQEELEESLITHNHLELLGRVTKHVELKTGVPRNDLLQMLAKFYKTHRYDRFSISLARGIDKETAALRQFLGKHLGSDKKEMSPLFAIEKTKRHENFLRKLVLKISIELYAVIEKEAARLNLYTYELRDASKAQSVFLADINVSESEEDVLWKELLVFFVNTKDDSAGMKFLRSITPLDFDPALFQDYLECFRSNASKAYVMDELEALYEDIGNPGDRFELLGCLANPNVDFIEEEEGDSEK